MRARVHDLFCALFLFFPRQEWISCHGPDTRFWMSWLWVGRQREVLPRLKAESSVWSDHLDMKVASALMAVWGEDHCFEQEGAREEKKTKKNAAIVWISIFLFLSLVILVDSKDWIQTGEFVLFCSYKIKKKKKKGSNYLKNMSNFLHIFKLFKLFFIKTMYSIF